MYLLLHIFLILFCGITDAALVYPTTKTEGIVGFAKLGGVTGSWSGNVVEINNLADLQKYVNDNTPRVLVINSDIKASIKTVVTLGSNKSIIGSFNKPKLYNIYLQDSTSSGNVIFQNLIFQHDASIIGNGDRQIHLSRSSKHWIDHCSFVGHINYSPKADNPDKHLYVGESADYVTISNCYFGNHNYGLILGYPGDTAPAQYNLRLTICNNYFENIHNRAPGLMRHGQYHVYNNYVRNSDRSFTIHAEGKVFSENNYFEKCNRILNDFGTGQFTDSGSVGSIKGQKSPKCNWSPSLYYNYSLKTAAQSKSFVLLSAGAQSVNLSFNN